MNIYIGNLSSDTTEDQIRQTFRVFGEVTTLNIIKDKHSGEPKGFAFAEMPVKEQALAAIEGVIGQELNGRKLNINQAKPHTKSGNRVGGNTYRKVY